MALDFFQKIVEQRIQEALRDGEFDNLAGSGRALEFDDDEHVPQDLRLAFKILKNADCLPPELDLRSDIVRIRELLESVEDDERRRHLVRDFNLKILNLNMMHRVPLDAEAGQLYGGNGSDEQGSAPKK
jgi:hypothetical protein